MPHQCVRCSKIYENGAQELLKGCICGAKLFFFVKQSFIEQNNKKEILQNLTDEDKTKIEKDVQDLMDNTKDDDVVILDFESVKLTGNGKYELDLVSLFKDEPLIYKLEEGKYMIDIAEAFNSASEK